MRTREWIALAAGGLVLGSALAAEAVRQPAPEATATFVNGKGERIGTARLHSTRNGVLIDLTVSQLPAGEHAFHIHLTGKCDPKDGFKSAGDHFAPHNSAHGYQAKDGPHAGDMPNQFVGKDGTLRAHVFNPHVRLDDGDTGLFGRDGTALVLHAKPDDYRSQPSGDAGDRIACAVIERAAPKRTAAAAEEDERADAARQRAETRTEEAATDVERPGGT